MTGTLYHLSSRFSAVFQIFHRCIHTIERSLFIAVTLCCGGIFGISCDISWSVIPFGFSLQRCTTLSSKSTASTASCFMTTSATAILDFKARLCNHAICGLVAKQPGGAKIQYASLRFNLRFFWLATLLFKV